jgi:hypothetical protein
VRVRFIAPAQQEFDDAVKYHNAKIPGLGDDLFDEIVSAAQKLCEFPEM